jgi:hypothetical protein
MEWKDAINYFWGFTVCMVLICFGSSLPLYWLVLSQETIEQTLHCDGCARFTKDKMLKKAAGAGWRKPIAAC